MTVLVVTYAELGFIKFILVLKERDLQITTESGFGRNFTKQLSTSYYLKHIRDKIFTNLNI
jgi:hypothetical protein